MLRTDNYKRPFIVFIRIYKRYLCRHAKSKILGHVDKRDSTDLRPVIQAHLYVGDELGTQPDVRRRMDIL